MFSFPDHNRGACRPPPGFQVIHRIRLRRHGDKCPAVGRTRHVRAWGHFGDEKRDPVGHMRGVVHAFVEGLQSTRELIFHEHVAGRIGQVDGQHDFDQLAGQDRVEGLVGDWVKILPSHVHDRGGAPVNGEGKDRG